MATLAVANGLPAIAVVLDEPVEVCVARQHAREPGRRVPAHVIERMYTELVASASPAELLAEGFAAVAAVRAAGDTYTVDVYGGRWWHEVAPKDAVDITLPGAGIVGPLCEDGRVCPWPWDPQQLVGAPLGMYHCPYCGEMCVAGVPHPDYRNNPE